MISRSSLRQYVTILYIDTITFRTKCTYMCIVIYNYVMYEMAISNLNVKTQRDNEIIGNYNV
jgi:hypothetical protein